MGKILLILTALLLNACTNQTALLTPPSKINHDKYVYHLANQQDLGDVARFLYFVKPDNVENWRSQIEILLDRNKSNQTISERIALRERVYRNIGVQDFRLKTYQSKQGTRQDSLIGYVIYAPTKQNKTWQVDIARGQEIPNCGFVQYQYSQKIPKRNKYNHLSKTQLVKYLQKYVIAKEIKKLEALDWKWNCQK
ncbi:hypothetical protein [Rodentibacter caecimuris]|uniref:ATPases of ABC transporters with duplicated ATPase domains-containing protein n=1 Tax=Rodentibacter caecimuris TaxID=1796644 RepID=A0ABX3L0C8_9PAST|nr:hypothetical protein BKG89_01720 [Rodentibacter heylii]